MVLVPTFRPDRLADISTHNQAATRANKATLETMMLAPALHWTAPLPRATDTAGNANGSAQHAPHATAPTRATVPTRLGIVAPPFSG